ncbi:MAG: isochorismate synthase [Solirubrobacterales bacterium]
MSLWSRSRRSAGRVRERGEVEQGFGASAYARLAGNINLASARARARGRPIIAGVTVPVAPEIDLLECVASAREPGEFWSSVDQPARDCRALASLGVAVRVQACGTDRFTRIAEKCAAALDAAEVDDLADDPGAPAGAGAAWIGGFSFHQDGPHSDAWRAMPAADFILPSVAIVRHGGECPVARLTVNVHVAPDDHAADLLAQVESLVDRLGLNESEGASGLSGGLEHSSKRSCELEIKPEPTRDLESAAERSPPFDIAASVAATATAEHYQQAVERATEMIAAGELEKIVLAREVLLRRREPIDVVAALRELRERFPQCTTFALGYPATTFLGSSPELLIRREGRRASTMALAGSASRGDDAEQDERLGAKLLESVKDNREHAIVVRRIERTLGRLSAWVAVGERPELVKVKNIQHLATPIRAQLTEPRPAIELAGMLHPTPAVGGEPWSVAGPAIKSLEGFDRGWYAGGVGWMDQLEDGEFHVALRSALIDGSSARLFAGAGIVADSDPATELAETETKLDALLPVLSSC